MARSPADPLVRCESPDAGRCRACGLLGGSCFPPVGPTADERRAVELLVGGLLGRSFADLQTAIDRLGPTATDGGPGMRAAVALTLAETGREELERVFRRGR